VKVNVLLSPLRANSWKSDNYRKLNGGMKQRNYTKKIKQRRLRAITLQGAIEKSPILEKMIIG
jgi:hypothetical protein